MAKAVNRLVGELMVEGPERANSPSPNPLPQGEGASQMQMSVSVRISTDDCRQVRMGPVVKWMWPMLSGAIGSGRKSYPGLSARAEGRYANFAN